MSPLRVALAQTSPVSADPGPPALEKAHSTSPFPTLDANLVDARDGVAAAAARGADVVVFPEYFLQGVVNDGRQYLTYASAHLQAFLAALARTHSVAVVGTIVHGNIPPAALHAPLPTGSPFEHLLTRGVGGITPAQRAWAVWLETHPQSYAEEVPVLHNTAFFIDADGELKGSYVKQNLWHPEREYLTPGTKGTHVFDTKWGKAGFQICWDVSHPASAQRLADEGASIVFHPTYWLATDSEPHVSRHAHAEDYETSALSALCFARALESETVWIMSNAGGDALEGFMGGSAVWAPLRGLVGGCGVPADLKIVEIDVQPVLADARDLYKVQQDWKARRG